MTKNKTIEIQTLQDERRDLFAAAALTGILAGQEDIIELGALIPATAAFTYADAMVEVSKK